MSPSPPGQVAEDDVSDNSAECVVCLSDVRDTLILPCRHLCLCNTCADTLRYQANNCPICRLREHTRGRVLIVEGAGDLGLLIPGSLGTAIPYYMKKGNTKSFTCKA